MAGLQRCGKSCRLRCINYLRPDLKRGALSLEEEKLIVELHSVVGNRWSQIAAQLPGRSDNEIKNVWSSCLKKKLKQRGIDPNTQVVTQLAQKASNAATESSGAENIEFFKDISSFGIGGYGLNSKNSSLSFNSISSSFLPSSRILPFVPSSSPSTTLNPIRHSSDVKEDRIQGQAEINKCSQYQYSPVLLGSSIAKANQTSSYEDLMRPLDTYFN